VRAIGERWALGTKWKSSRYGKGIENTNEIFVPNSFSASPPKGRMRRVTDEQMGDFRILERCSRVLYDVLVTL
jgi:hypothetical protein